VFFVVKQIIVFIKVFQMRKKQSQEMKDYCNSIQALARNDAERMAIRRWLRYQKNPLKVDEFLNLSASDIRNNFGLSPIQSFILNNFLREKRQSLLNLEKHPIAA
jgi:hypothetical protein